MITIRTEDTPTSEATAARDDRKQAARFRILKIRRKLRTPSWRPSAADAQVVETDAEDRICFGNPCSAFGCLSNAFGADQDRTFKLALDGLQRRSVEHFIQAQKFLGPGASLKDIRYARLIHMTRDPGFAKLLGEARLDGSAGVAPRADWHDVRDLITMRAVLEKFRQNPKLAEVLLGTLDRKLILDDPANRLGTILMLVRTHLRTTLPD